MDKPTDPYKSPYHAVIAGYGASVPEGILTNDDISKMVDTTDEWITTRTGIKTRHIATDEETTAMLAVQAAKIALKTAKVKAKEIDMIVVATITPEMVFPSTAAFVQKEIGAKNAWVFDLAAACSGFVYGVSVVHQFIETGRTSNALVIGAETLTKITDSKDRSSSILFGDGAGAVVVQRAEDNRRGVMYSSHYSDGGKWEALSCQAFGSKYPADKKLDDPDKIYMDINGREVYQSAIRRIVEVVNECLDRCNLKMDDIKMVIPHQMNARIIESAAKRLKIPDDKVFINIAEYGNTSAASIPIALDECARAGKIQRGDVIILVAFGAGLTWGANVIEF